MGKRVLVADDSATIQKAFAMVFGGQDVSLIAARTLDEAISAARQGRPDLVIADTNLGGRTGYELCAAVKSDPGLRGVPVYILASTHTPYDEPKGREAGADGHLQKPFESQGIIDKVNDILSRSAAATGAVAARVAPVAAAPAAAAPSRPVAASATGPAPVARARQDHVEIDDDDYGEVTIERTPLAPTPARPVAAPGGLSAAAQAAPMPSTAPVPAPPAPAPAAGSGYSGLGLRPSLIPGARPGIPPRPAPASTLAASTLATSAGGAAMSGPSASSPALPNYGLRPGPASGAGIGSPPVAPAPAASAAPGGAPMASPSPFAAAPAPAAQAGVGRTMMGMPAVVIPGVPRTGGAAQPASPLPSPGMAPAPKGPSFTAATVPLPAAAPVALAPSPAPIAPSPAPSPPSLALSFAPAPAPMAAGAAAGAAISARVDQKLSAFAARGPEYEAIARLSREVIEEIVWEVVPELAEIIIREHVERLGIGKKTS